MDLFNTHSQGRVIIVVLKIVSTTAQLMRSSVKLLHEGSI